MPQFPPEWIPLFGVAYLAVINFLAFFMFGVDKKRSIHGEWRIPESRLLVVSAIGGIFGAFAGSRYYRHKTHKQPFKSYLRAIACLQVASAIITAFPKSFYRLYELLTLLLRFNT